MYDLLLPSGLEGLRHFAACYEFHWNLDQILGLKKNQKGSHLPSVLRGGDCINALGTAFFC